MNAQRQEHRASYRTKQNYKSYLVNRCPVIPSDNFAADFCITLIQLDVIYFFIVIYFFY